MPEATPMKKEAVSWVTDNILLNELVELYMSNNLHYLYIPNDFGLRTNILRVLSIYFSMQENINFEKMRKRINSSDLLCVVP